MRSFVLVLVLLASLAVACTLEDGEEGPAGQLVVGVTVGEVPDDSIVGLEVSVREWWLRDATGAWISIPLQRQSFDIYQLSGVLTGVADTHIPVGSYDRVRIVFAEATVMDADGASQAIMPADAVETEIALDMARGDTMVLVATVAATVSIREPGLYSVAPMVTAQAYPSPNARIDEEGTVIKS